MDWKLTPTENVDIISLDSAKQEVRKEDDDEDAKIQAYINSAVALFESHTGYILRSGTLTLQFSYKNLKQIRSSGNNDFLSAYDSGSSYGNFNALLNLNNSRRPSYRLPIGIEVEAQKPTAFSFNSLDQEPVKLTADDIAQYLPDDFFLPQVKKPLVFFFSGDFEDLRIEKKFSVLAENIQMDIAIEKNFVKEDIDITLKRMISMMYENPDYMVEFAKDEVINSTFRTYNCQVGL